MNQALSHIVDFIKEYSDLDFTGYRESMLERRIKKRLAPSASKSLEDYHDYLKTHPGELDLLIEVLTIGVSWFFRDSLTFEFLSKLLDKVIKEKIEGGDKFIRVWSSGCSSGEEAYSVAMIINDILLKEQTDFKQHIFATDIDRSALLVAKNGNYSGDAVKNIKQGQFSAYFSSRGMDNKLDPHIKKQVSFSFFDLLDKKLISPPDSIFGDFDLILCRNVLIYYDMKYQKIIFNKLYRSLRKDGYLVLGEAETPVGEFKDKFVRENTDSKIYRKIT